MVVCTREELFDRISAARAKGTQALRYRLAMLERRLRQQGIDRALGILHRRIGRGLQQTDEHEYRMRERLRAVIESRERARRTLEARLRQFDVRPRLAADRRRLEAAHRATLDAMRARLAERRRMQPVKRVIESVPVENGVVTDAAAVAPNSAIHVRLHRGSLDAVVSPSNPAE